jgi:hypothetical protein
MTGECGGGEDEGGTENCNSESVHFKSPLSRPVAA